jgi:hypothetical protein
MPQRRKESTEERYRRERDECRREINRYRRERDSYKMKVDHCHAELDNYIMLSRHLRNHIELVERSAVNAIPVQESVPPELRTLIAEPILSGEVVEPEQEPEPEPEPELISGEVLEPEPETKPEERDLVDEMMKLGREAGWELPPKPGETWENYFKRLIIESKRGKKSKGCCGSRPRAGMKKKKKKQTRRRKSNPTNKRKHKQTRSYKKMKH